MASTTPTVEVVGARQLAATMKRAGADLRDLTALNRSAAAVVGAAAKARAPRRSGALAGSVRVGGTRTAGTVRAGSASVPYAMPIHWGWPSRNITAQPFISDAARDTEPVWTAVYRVGVERILTKIEGT
jgi:hypothetical protein